MSLWLNIQSTEGEKFSSSSGSSFGSKPSPIDSGDNPSKESEYSISQVIPKKVEISVTIESEKMRPKKVCLDYRERPEKLKSNILKQFNQYSKKYHSDWVVNGNGTDYNLCGISALQLAEHIISSNSKKQKEFYILDIGAGNFGFGMSLAYYLNMSNKIPEDVRINIISTRAEINKEVEKTQGKCKLYEFGEFQAENLCSELERVGFFLNKKIDLIVSRKCFTHLVDGPGTFTQACSLLKPETGYMLMDKMFE